MKQSPKRQKAKPKLKRGKGKKPKLSDKEQSARFIANARMVETSESEGWFKTAVARIFRAKV